MRTSATPWTTTLLLVGGLGGARAQPAASPPEPGSPESAPVPAPAAVAVPPAPPTAAPAPAPSAPEAPEPVEASGLHLEAGLGFGRYRESAPGLTFNSDLQPFLRIGTEVVVRSGRGHVVFQAAGGFGTDVHMEAKVDGMVVQENRFHQQIFEASPRYRWHKGPRLYLEVGYRFTVQRLFFTDIPMIGDALETVLVHAIEGGLKWRRTAADGGRRQLDLVIGLNRAGAENDLIEGESFGAGGLSFNARAQKRWASGTSVEGQLAYRKQNGSDPEEVEFQGMTTTAFWPDNVTWQLLVVAGFAL